MDKDNKEVSDLGDYVDEFSQEHFGVDKKMGMPFKVWRINLKESTSRCRSLRIRGLKFTKSYVGFGGQE